MGKKKRKSNKKQYWGLPKEARLEKGKSWLETYEGDTIVKAYSKIFGLNYKNAMKDLKSIGVRISQHERDDIKRILENKEMAKARKKEKRASERIEEWESDDTFAFIVGYTEGGVPYGVTHEEWEEDE
ncbi:hypothetical protein ACWE42_18385 [Sutcliffiella cohnii]